EYLTAAVALDPDYGVARKLWANTPWALDRAVTREQPAPLPNWSHDELMVEEDLDLALALPLAEDAHAPGRAAGAARPPAGLDTPPPTTLPAWVAQMGGTAAT